MRSLTIASKELRDVIRDKSIVTAFLVQLFLAGFSALLLAGLTAIHSPGSVDATPEATIAYDGPGGLRPYLQRAEGLLVVDRGAADAMALFRSGDVDAVVQEDYADNASLRQATLVFADGELEASLLVARLKDVLIDYQSDLRVERAERLEQEVVILDTDVEAGPYGFVYAVLIPLLVITPVFLSGAIAGDALSQESRTRTLLLLRCAPLSTWELVVGKLLVPVLLVPLQVAVWLILFAVNGYAVLAPWTVLGYALVLGILLTAAGSIVAALVRDESQTQAAYALLVLGLGTFSLLLPRDPLNTIALLGTGAADGATWSSVLLTAALAALVLAMGILTTARRIRTDRL